ncbi:mitogen-activated protein kinase kinase kinase 2-like [Physella acuta]|uniref:mitogen-activated protein kinase kinase kinase 2-like n=1 Tax=Physella acuta TaxID=109671 RepID=UPI0027DB0FB8|nr:mitogen-activated protein kinase kinase kinase 2-like [Physella acuta]
MPGRNSGKDLEELEYTTECLKEMSKNREASQKIITSQDLTDRLVMLDNSGNRSISENQQECQFGSRTLCFPHWFQYDNCLGTLASFVSLKGNLDEKMTRHFTIQILEGVNYLHQKDICHRDIKGNSILMEDDMNIKLTDFGIAEFINGNGMVTEKGTVRYMAPEVMSVGCTVMEMLTGKPPNSSLPTPNVVFRTVMGEPPHYQLSPASSVNLLEFLDKILHLQHHQLTYWSF